MKANKWGSAGGAGYVDMAMWIRDGSWVKPWAGRCGAATRMELGAHRAAALASFSYILPSPAGLLNVKSN